MTKLKKGKSRALNLIEKEFENVHMHSEENESRLPDEVFWLDSIPKRKNRRWITPLYYIVTISAMVATFLIVFTYVFGKGWIGNILDEEKDSENGFEFVLPLAQRPELEGDENYTSDGKYTVQGVAKAVEKSVVTIYSYVRTGDEIVSGQGSGVIMSEDGFIVTNAHVVSGSDEVTLRVRTYDDVYYSAKVVGMDEMSDIAVIKISENGLSPAIFGDSTQLCVGEQIVAIGSPGGLTGTVSTGIVSGLNRAIYTDDISLTDCIQIDAPINPGNSGGALVNMWGQVVGIVSAKLEAEDYDGIGFAISSAKAKKIVEDLMEYGCVAGRVKIGIVFYVYSDPSLQETEGLLIAEIEEDCDIFNSGLHVGDTITKIEGKKITSADDVSEILEDKYAGDELTFEYVRDGEVFVSSFMLMPSDSLAVKD